jgi:hypothetical protein
MAGCGFVLDRADTLAVEVGVDAQLGLACLVGHGARLLADVGEG